MTDILGNALEQPLWIMHLLWWLCHVMGYCIVLAFENILMFFVGLHECCSLVDKLGCWYTLYVYWMCRTWFSYKQPIFFCMLLHMTQDYATH